MAVTSPPARLWNAARQLPGRTPLRVKLISALLALVAIALVVISIAGISVLKSYLLGQADNTLQNFSGQSYRLAGEYLLGAQPAVDYGGVAIAWIPSDGHLHPVLDPASGLGRQSQGRILPLPDVPTTARWLAANDGRPVTVAAESGSSRWRVLALPHQFLTADGGSVSGTVIVGLDVSNVYATIGHLIGIDLIVSLLIVLVLAIVGITVVRRSLRPLTEIERTAEAIAAGDMSRRVPDRDPRTEVGRLGRSLNAMLAHVETAFHVRADSEAAARRSEERIRQFVADASHELRTPLTAIRGFAEYYRQRGGLENGRPESSAFENSAPEHSVPEHSAFENSVPENSVPESSVPDGASVGHAGLPDGPAGELRAADPGAAASARGGNPLTRSDLDRIMRRVEQESSRMGVLVEDMLLLARLDQQRPLENRPVDLLTLAADAVHDARVMAPQRSIDLTVGAGAALIVLGDEVRLRQVIGNLMSNALIHTPDGTPVEVRIRSGRLDEGHAGARGPIMPAGGPELAAGGSARPAVILEVADRGPGLTPDQAERAFERFYRADQARARQAGGTGLGLAIVAALVVAHGGRVSVEPTPGSGATFRIALPLAPEALGPGPEQEDRPDGQPAPDGESGLSGMSGPDVESHAGPGPAAS